jgi:hypothetical protein
MNTHTRGVVQQVKLAFRHKALLATLIGFLLGGFVPVACYVIAHREGAAFDLAGSKSLGLVVGGLAYSAKTVYEWSKLAFTSAVKSLGFVVLLEGVMITSHTVWLGMTALGYLIVINGIATGCTLSVGRRVR